MNEDALRALVRDTIARLESAQAGSSAPVSEAPGLLHLSSHPSHYRYNLPPSDGPCIIEPGVQCNHCGYCESHGH
jgi:hypothetical protein